MAFGERFNDPGILDGGSLPEGPDTTLSGRFCRSSRVLRAGDRRVRRPRAYGVLGRAAGRGCRRHSSLLSGAGLVAPRFSEQALKLNGEMVKLARAINHPFSLEYALHHTGWLYQHCRLGMKAQAAGDEQIRIATEQGFLFWHASGTLYAGGGLLLQEPTGAGDSATAKMAWKPTEARAPELARSVLLEHTGRWLLAGEEIRRSARSPERGTRTRGEERRAIPRSGIASAQWRIGSG